MKPNIIVKGIAIALVFIVILVVVKSHKKNEVAIVNNPTTVESEVIGLGAAEQGPTQTDNGLAFDPMTDKYLEKEYGVDVDSPVETMRTLTNETKAVRQDSEKLQDVSKKKDQKIERLLKMKDDLSKQMDGKFNNLKTAQEEKEREAQHEKELTLGLFEKLQKKLEELENKDSQKSSPKGKVTESIGKSENGYDIGSAGIPSGLGYDENGKLLESEEIVWTNPMEAQVDPKDPNKISLPEFSTAPTQKVHESSKVPEKEKQKNKDERLIKAYSIPIEGTLFGSVSMTAMLGRIPVGGQVVDPYPFKIIVGEENLSSNGISIPGVTGILMSGIAKGDWTLSCVSGEINSMTFTFADGTIKSFPEPGTKSREAIAWFSDANGVPCISGERITNAASYLTSRVALTSAASYANAEAQSQFTTQTNGSGMTKGLTGDPSVVAKNTAISEGVNEVADWLDARQANSFDAIYVPPGTKLHVHIKEELRIDYDPEGRKVNHYANINYRSDHHLD